MNWYYADQGKQTGPVTQDQIEQLVRDGKIQPETLVWREGMATWLPYRDVTAAPPSLAAPADAGYVPGQSPEAVCAECHNMFAIKDMIRHGDAYICANCKPIFMQKLAEGAPIQTGQLNYAGFWTRFAAVFLDGLILTVVNFLIRLAVGQSAMEATGLQPQTANALVVILLAIQLAIAICYEGLLIGKYGATLGKMACKIKVVTAEGDRVSYPRSFARYFSKIISYMVCLIGFIMAGFDSQKRALHDYICNTRVVFK